MIHDGNGMAMMYRPQCGDRQGDPPAAQRYVDSQDPVLVKWALNTTTPAKRDAVEVQDPWTGQWLDACLVIYADDMARVGPWRCRSES